MQLDGHQEEKQLLHLSLQQKHAETTGNLTTLLDTCNILSPLLPFSLPDISGKIEIQFSARYILEDSMEMEMVIDSQGLSLPGLDIDSLTGKVALHADSFESLTFHRGSHIYVSDIQSSAANLKKLYFQFSGNLANTQEQLALALNNNSRVLIEDFRRESLHVKYGEITPALQFIHGPVGRSITLFPEFTAVIKELGLNKFSIPDLSLSLEKPISFTLLPDRNANWKSGGGKIIAEVDTMGFQDLSIHPNILTVEIHDQKDITAPLQFHCHIHNEKLSVQWKDKYIPLQNLQAYLAADNRNLQLNASFSHANVPGQIEGTVSHDLHYSTGKARLSTVRPLDLRDEHITIHELVNGFHLPFSISSALIDSTTTLQWVKNEPSLSTPSFI